MNRRNSFFGKPDIILILLFFFLIIFGWVNIYSSSITEESADILDFTTSHGKQIIWMAVCTFIALFIMLIDVRFFPIFSFFIYGISLALLVLVLFIGQEVDGNKAWFAITPTIKVQPSEFAKVATALALSFVIASQGFTFKRNKWWIYTLAIIFIPAVLIILEDDTGSTLVFSAFILVLFRFGFPWILLIIGVTMVTLFFLGIVVPIGYIILGLTIIAGIAWFITRNLKNYWKLVLAGYIVLVGFSAAIKPIFDNALKPHHKTRIYVLLGIEKDLRGTGWNVNNSKIAIGSGGITGKGFLHGTLTKLKFVPKQRTDFIFCTVGEEWGFVGSVFIVLLYLFLLIRIIHVAERQRATFSKAYGYCVACIIFFHFVMNIGTTIGLAPAVGLPLPFFSYGGSSMMGFTLLLWIFIRLDSQNRNLLGNAL